MKIVALAKAAPNLDAAVKALAAAANMTAAEARMRLAPEPPALIARLAPEVADSLVAALRAAGLACLAVDEAEIPEKFLTRTFALGATLDFTSRTGATESLEPASVMAILRAASSVRETSERTEKVKQFSATTAVITGGLSFSKTETRTTRSQSEETEQALFVFGREGQAIVLRETATDFSCLGKAMQPSRIANMTVLSQQLRKAAPNAFYDERLVRLGRRPLPFVTGGEMHMQSRGTSQTRVNTTSGLEVLAEVMRLAVASGVLP